MSAIACRRQTAKQACEIMRVLQVNRKAMVCEAGARDTAQVSICLVLGSGIHREDDRTARERAARRPK